MQGWIELGNAGFDLVWRASVQVALLVAAVLVLERLVGRWLTPRWRYGLWLLVAARLVVPVPLSVAHGGLEGLLAALQSVPAAESNGDPRKEAAPLALQPVPIGSLAPRAERGARTLPTQEPAQSSPQPSPQSSPQGLAPSRRPRPALTTVVESVPRPAASPSAKPAAPWPWRALACACLGLIGAALLALDGTRVLLFHLRLRAARPVLAQGPRALLTLCCGRMGVRADARLLEVTGLASPAVTGLGRPTVLLPVGLAARLSDDELRHVLLHELAHWRRRDVPLGLVVCALHSLYWFHPLVRVGLRRLRASQEVARDWEALDADRSPAPCSYARTLLKLCDGVRVPPAGPLPDFLDGGRDIAKRIHMIQAYRPARRSALLGTTLLVTLGWASFTSAALPDAPTPSRSRSQLRHIDVEHVQQTAPWRTALEAVLDREVTLTFDDAPAAQVVEHLRAITGANIVIQQHLLDDYDPYLTLAVGETPLRDTLDLVCRLMTDDAGWALINRAIYIGVDAYEREPKELRFYDIGPFLDGEDFAEEVAEQLCTVVMEFSHPDGERWEQLGVRIEAWNDLLIVSQTPDMHDRVKYILERFLNRGACPQEDVPAWRERLHAVLAAPTELKADGLELGEVCALLTARHGVSIACPEDLGHEYVNLVLSDVSLGTALDWLCADHGLRVVLEGGVILLEEDGLGELSLEFYELGQVLEAFDESDSDGVAEVVSEMIRDQVDPESWDLDPGCMLTFWNDMMLVNQTPAVHAQVRLLLGALERAVGE